ncbi:uncharacterized protein N7529_007611 [Penicillium soppii]|uniref:uncharacterized protein n=1 Tax=Penicillium soppii TaxID=69789 RepID=UPI002547D9B0|nr:uncharacterized protein N7529_007611 [Penicillium soppii]KAJ5860301.1 hypothetical protein N7529_007611 [Penicillium soppii]
MASQNGSTAKDMGLSPAPLSINSSDGPKTGDKRPRLPDLPYVPTYDTQITSGYPESVSILDYRAGQEVRPIQQSPKRPRTASFVPVNLPAQSALEDNKPTAVHSLLHETPRRQLLRSPSPTIRGDETLIRCDLTSEINIQREKHRNLPANCLQLIRKLLKKAKLERPSKPSPEDPSMADDWLDEDELMEICASKIEKGGRSSRALLTRLERFLYGPLMSSEEKKSLELTICIEECLSSSKSASDFNLLLLRRLERIVDDPSAYGLYESDIEFESLREIITTALSNSSPLDRWMMRKVAQLLDPEGVHGKPIQDSPKPSREVTTKDSKKDTNSTARKVPVKSSRSPFAPSPETPALPSEATRRSPSRLLSLLSPTTTHLPSSSSLCLDIPSGFQQSSSALESNLSTLNPVVDIAELTEDEMRKFTADEKKCLIPSDRAREAQRRANLQAATSNRSTSQGVLQTGAASAPTTTPGPSNHRSPTENPVDTAMRSDPSPAFSFRTPHLSASAQPLDHPASTEMLASTVRPSRSVAPVTKKRSAPGTQAFGSEIPKKLLNIFLDKVAPILPILDLDQLNVTFSLAVDYGYLTYEKIDPTIGFCFAIASLLTRDRQLWNAVEWYEAATKKVENDAQGVETLEWFKMRILQIRYLHMTGKLRESLYISSMVIVKAQWFNMHYPHGGHLAVDDDSRQQCRVIWRALCMAKISISLQVGFCDELSPYDRMPRRSTLEENMGASVATTDSAYAISAFFEASANIYQYANELVHLEEDLRVVRPECPMKWLSSVDLRDSTLDTELSKWEASLPECLRWKGPDITSLTEEDPTIRRMCVFTHLRYMYFRLRQHRPYLILYTRLLHACECKTRPHMSSREMDSAPTPMDLLIIRGCAVECLDEAQDIIKTLWAPSGNGQDDNLQAVTLSERVDYIYTAALVLIAARAIPFIVTGGVAHSVSTLTNMINQADIMLRSCEEACEQCPDFARRIQHARAFLSLLGRQSIGSHDGIICHISDVNLHISCSVWLNIYSRLGVEFSYKKFPRSNEQSVGIDRIFGWAESLPSDFDE